MNSYNMFSVKRDTIHGLLVFIIYIIFLLFKHINQLKQLNIQHDVILHLHARLHEIAYSIKRSAQQRNDCYGIYSVSVTDA